MKKRKVLVSILCAAALLGVSTTTLTGCKKDKDPEPTPEVQKFTVTFNSKGGSSVNKLDNIESGSKIAAPTAPTRTNYDFAGWYKDEGYSTQWKFDTDTVTASITLYAKWTPKGEEPEPVKKFTVTFDTDGGSAVAAIENVENGKKIEKPANPTKEGHTFDHWVKADGTAWNFDVDTVTANITLKATWTKNGGDTPTPAEKWTVTFDTDGGSAVEALANVENGKKIEKPANPTKEGHTFDHWVKADGTAWNFDVDTVTANITLKATWTKNGGDTPTPAEKWTVTFDTDGGSAVEALANVENGKKIEKPANPTKEGHTFDHWVKADGTAWNFDVDTVTANITLKATWIKDDEPVGPIELVQIQVSPGSVSIVEGLTSSLTVIYTPSNAQASDKAITWSSSDETIATVDDNGVVTAISVGKVTITATSANGKQASCAVEVTEKAVPLENFTIKVGEGNTDRVTLTPTHKTETLVAQLNPSNATGVKINWTASDPAIVKITPKDDEGLEVEVEMLLQGTEQITITATVEGDETKKAQVFCTADTYYGTIIKEEEAPLVLNETFVGYDANAKLPEWSGTWGTAGVYGAAKSPATYDTHYASIVHNEQNGNNRVTLVDPDDSQTSGGTSKLIIDYGNIDGKIIGYVNVKLPNPGTSWTFMQFIGGSGSEVFGLRLQEKVKNDKKYMVHYRVNGGDPVLPKDSNGADIDIQVLADSTLRIYYIMDWNEDRGAYNISLIINGIEYLTNFETTVTAFAGVQFETSNKAAKTVTVDNIAVANNPVGLDAVQAKLVEKLTAAYNNLTAVEGTYSDENKQVLDQLFGTAKTNILNVAVSDTVTIAQAKAQAQAIYDQAVIDMSAVETKADTALEEAQANATTELAAYKSASDYTINEADFTLALENGETAISNAQTPEDVALVLQAAKDALDAIDNDATALDKINTAKLAELAAYDGGAENFNTTVTLTFKNPNADPTVNNYSNVSTYKNAYDEGVRTIGVAYAKAVAGEATYLEVVAEIDERLVAAKVAIDLCKNNAELLEEVRDAAKTHINRYRADERTADKIVDCTVQPGEPGYYDKDTVLQGLADEISAGAKNISEFTSFERIQSEVTKVEDAIDTFIKAYSDIPFDEFKADTLDEFTAYYNGLIAGQTNQTILTELETAYQTQYGKLDEITTGKAVLSEAYSAAKVHLDIHNDKFIRNDELDREAAAQKALIVNATVAGEIDAICAQAKADIAAIIDREDPVCTMGDLANITNTAKAAMAQKVADLKATKYTVTLVDQNGTALKDNLEVLYGTAVTLSELHVTTKTIVSASYKDAENQSISITTDSPVTVYDNLEITVVTADIEGFEGSITASAPETIENENGIDTDGDGVADQFGGDPFNGLDNSLFSLTIPNATYINGNTKIDSAGKMLKDGKITIAGKDFTSVIRTSVPKKETNPGRSETLKFVVKENLESLDIYLKLSGNNGVDNRDGTFYYNISDIVDDALTNDLVYEQLQSGKDILGAFVGLKRGQVIRIYVENSSTSGAALHIGDINAVVAQDKVVRDVTVTWNDLTDENDETLVEHYAYFETVNIPEQKPTAGGSFTGWKYNNGTEDVPYDSAAKFPSGSTITMIPTYQQANVVITLMNGDEVFEIIKEALEANQTGIAAPTNKPAATNENEEFKYWYETDDTVAYDFTVVTAGTTVTLHAKFGVIVPKDDQVLATDYSSISSASLNINSDKQYFTVSSNDTTFTYNAGGALEAKGSGRQIDITAKDNVKTMTVTITLSIGDSGGLTSKNGNIIVSGSGTIKVGSNFESINSQTVAVAKNVVTIEITLTAGQTATFKASTSRLNFYSAVAKVVEL